MKGWKIRIQLLSLSVIVVCFFLPFAKSCDTTIHVPYREITRLSTDRDLEAVMFFLMVAILFLYPLLLGVAKLILSRLDAGKKRLEFAKALTGIFLSVCVFLLFMFLKEKPNTWDEYYGITYLMILTVLTGMLLVQFSWPKFVRFMPTLLSAFSFCTILFWFLTVGHDRLIGAWISLPASLIALLTFVL